MIFHCSADRGWHLDEPADFRGFKVVLAGIEPNEAPPIPGLRFEPDAAGTVHAWIAPELPARLAGPVVDPAWRTAFAGMVAFAAKHAWVGPDGAIRAHVERHDTAAIDR